MKYTVIATIQGSETAEVKYCTETSAVEAVSAVATILASEEGFHAPWTPNLLSVRIEVSR